MASNVIATSFTTTNYASKKLDGTKIAKLEPNAFGTPMIGYPLKKSERAKGALAVSSKVSGATISAPDYVSKKSAANGVLPGDEVGAVFYNTNGYIFNGLNDALELPSSEPTHVRDWHGRVVVSYPWWIAANGSGEFTHMSRNFFDEGSIAAVVYRVINDAGKPYDWLFAWENPYDRDHEATTLRAYTRILEKDAPIDWPAVRTVLSDSPSESSHVDEASGLRATATIRYEAGSTTSVNFVATVSNT